jgi:hypothetical protein
VASIVLQFQAGLSKVLTKIYQSRFIYIQQDDLCLYLSAVYGIEGKLDSRYLASTQSVLRSIVKVGEQPNFSFNLHANGAMGGISRIAAHLHILQHQVRPVGS